MRTLVRFSASRPGLRLRSIPSRTVFRRAIRPRSTAATEASAERQAGSNVRSHAPRNSPSDGVPPKTVEAPTSIWSRGLRPIVNLLARVDRFNTRRPFVVQAIGSFNVYLWSDLFAQSIEGGEYDPIRTLRNLVIGGIMTYPGYRWYIYLGTHFNYASKLGSLAAKIVVQQITFAPIFNIYFFSMHAILSGKTVQQAFERVKHTFWESMKNSIKLWPAVTAFTFSYVKPQYRFLTAGVVATFWQSYLSWLNQREARKSKLSDPTPTRMLEQT